MFSLILNIAFVTVCVRACVCTVCMCVRVYMCVGRITIFGMFILRSPRWILSLCDY